MTTPASKLVFISPFNLFDPANGAVQSIRTMLEQLTHHGYECHALTACCFEGAASGSPAEVLSDQGLTASGQIAAYKLPVWQGSKKSVSYNAVQIPTTTRDQMTAVEELIFRDTIKAWLEQHRPDIVITFGGYLLDIEIQRCARAVGAKVVFYLANSRYGRPDTFLNVDLVITNSASAVTHYENTLKLACHNVGVFVDSQACIAQQRDPRFVSFINPIPEKGVTLFLKLVEKATRELPAIRFMVVESRGQLATALQQSHMSAAMLNQITVLPLQQNMSAVYAKTRVLLMPSFWLESAGRILIEANANGIPVIASDFGGIPETLAISEHLFPVPEKCKMNFWNVPTDEEIEVWWQALKKLWDDDTYYRRSSEQALAVAKSQTLHNKVTHLADLLRSII